MPRGMCSWRNEVSHKLGGTDYLLDAAGPRRECAAAEPVDCAVKFTGGYVTGGLDDIRQTLACGLNDMKTKAAMENGPASAKAADETGTACGDCGSCATLPAAQITWAQRPRPGCGPRWTIGLDS